jgi:DNA-binding NarL/FixJ family response regulator
VAVTVAGQALVLGTAGVERELAEAMLADAGWAQPGPAGDRDSDRGVGRVVDVVVLVAPTAQTWADAAAVGRPVVVVHPDGRADLRTLLDALRRGAAAVVDGESGRADFHASMAAAARGDVRLSVRQVGDLVAAVDEGSRETLSPTRRELEILRSIQTGHSVKQTARHLGITVKTVENIQRRLLRKLGARNRADALMRAHRLGVLTEPAREAPELVRSTGCVVDGRPTDLPA